MKITLYTPDGEPITYDKCELMTDWYVGAGGSLPVDTLEFVGTPLWIMDSGPVRAVTSLPFLIHEPVPVSGVAEVFALSPLVQDNIPKGAQ